MQMCKAHARCGHGDPIVRHALSIVVRSVPQRSGRRIELLVRTECVAKACEQYQYPAGDNIRAHSLIEEDEGEQCRPHRLCG